jgi:hypothetical protein
MAQRKQTPDVLAEILGGGQPAAVEAQPALSTPSPAKVKSVSRSKTPARAVRPPVVVARQYQVVSFQEHKGWHARYVNGIEIANWTTSPLLHEYIQQMAGQGWELVSAASGESLYGLSDKHQLYFCRRA